ncbi:hypothetical protein C9939_02530 [Pseudidiomarina aestuarii]|nr:hypothetical protein C9939_02530 [Pseudidiomarina aestuarii]
MNIIGVMGWLPARLRNMFGMVNESEIDVVLDASGFSYGDQWNPAVARDRIGSTIKSFNQRDVPVIFLPQALGSFEKADVRQMFQHIAKHADLLFPRDDHSLQFVQALLSENERQKISRCPDFTNLIKGNVATEFDEHLHQVCFIPNSKMVEKRNDGAQYVEFMVQAIETAIQSDSKPFVLIHEAEADRELTRQVMSRLSREIPVLDPQDALKIKWIIGQSRLVISSRFHGLVSALSQGIPVVATGWSHKYQELLRDYECAEQLFDVSEDLEAALDSIRTLLADSNEYDALQTRIHNASAWQRESVTQMWDRVFQLIQESKQSA